MELTWKFTLRLIAFQHLSKNSQDVTKRWVNEAQEAVNSDNIMVQVGELCRRIVFYFIIMSIYKAHNLHRDCSKHTHTHKHTDYTKLELYSTHNLKQAAGTSEGWRQQHEAENLAGL